MFCPNCEILMVPFRKGKQRGTFCKKCGHAKYNTELVGPPKAIAQANPSFPLFPYDKIRCGQKEFMEDLHIASSDHKILIAQAPTGIGKTAATLSVLLQDAMDPKRTLFFLTSKQSQHTIVIDTLNSISKRSRQRIKAIDIISRQAMCPDPGSNQPGYAFAEYCKGKSKRCKFDHPSQDKAEKLVFSSIMHVQELKKVCARSGYCPSKTAQEAMAAAQVVVCDYNYIFDGLAKPFLEKAGKGFQDMLLVVDEAHNLSDRIRSNMSLTLNSYDIGEASHETQGKGSRGHNYTKAIGKALEDRAAKLPDNGEQYIDKEWLHEVLSSAFSEILGKADTFEDYVGWLKDTGEAIMKQGAERSFALELAEFLDRWASDRIGLVRILARRSDGSWVLKIAFLDPERVSGPILSEVGAAVLMSGTLCPTSMYADILGVPKDRRMERVYSSPFPKENRLVLGIKGLTSQYSRRDENMYEGYAQSLLSVCSVVKGNVAAFFPSYKFLEDVTARLRGKLIRKELMVETRQMTKRDREDILVRLSDKDASYLLLAVQGGGLSEGIDYKGNILSVIALAGIPLAPPNLEVKSLIKHYSTRFGEDLGELYGYYAPAINKIVQGAGRLIRSETDRGVIILMDQRFAQERYSAFLPPEMRPGRFGTKEEIGTDLVSFFNGA